MWKKLTEEIFKVYEEETANDPHWNDYDLDKVQRNRLILFVIVYCVGLALKNGYFQHSYPFHIPFSLNFIRFRVASE